MHLLLLNQFVPPDHSPTAQLLGDVATALEADGHTITLIGEPGGYRQRKTLLGSRALRELASLTKLLFRSLAAPKADAIIFFTSPPALPFIAYLTSKFHRAHLLHWAMDVYPEVAVALGELRQTSPVTRLTGAACRLAYRRCTHLVALDEDMAAHFRQSHGISADRIRVLSPWPPRATLSNTPTSPPDQFTWLYSGNLGRAHEWKTLLDAQQLIEQENHPIDLVFQGGGPARAEAQNYANSLNLRRCHWRDYAPPEQLVPSLLDTDLHIVTQRPETRGYLWPSKLALLFLLPRPIVFVGDVSSAIASSVKSHPDSLAIAPGEAQQLADHLITCFHQQPGRKTADLSQISTRIAQVRETGTSHWSQWLTPAQTNQKPKNRD